MSRAAAVGGAKPRNKDLSIRHLTGNLAPETFPLLIPDVVPNLHYIGKLDEIIDMPVKRLIYP